MDGWVYPKMVRVLRWSIFVVFSIFVSDFFLSIRYTIQSIYSLPLSKKKKKRWLKFMCKENVIWTINWSNEIDKCMLCESGSSSKKHFLYGLNFQERGNCTAMLSRNCISFVRMSVYILRIFHFVMKNLYAFAQ